MNVSRRLMGIQPITAASNARNGYAAFACNTTNGLQMRKISGSTITALPFNHTGLGNPVGVAWHPSGRFLYIATSVSPFLHFYERSGDTFTKRTDTITGAGGQGNAVSVSSDGAYLIMGISTSPYYAIYRLTDGVPSQKLSVPSLGSSSAAISVAISANGDFAFVGISVSPFIAIVQRSGDTYTRTGTLDINPVAALRQMKLDASGDYLVSVHSTGSSMRQVLWKRTGANLTRVTGFPDQTASFTYGCALSKNAALVTTGSAATPDGITLRLYANDGADNFSLIGTPDKAIGTAQAQDMSAEGDLLLVWHLTTPYMDFFKPSKTALVSLPEVPVASTTSNPTNAALWLEPLPVAA
ncbi:MULTISPECIES: hypothetical protein [unclassified Pseudomonas]|uniref:hypothetical protein n=1 Tax=unclassified Pseudomonas TaxID=196821 RepID=UPI001C60F01F|nr:MULTISPECIES: hypothetical protein [unclassified Pseudomonas]MBW5416100.1 hypothetical protein [Pseudomonas sp. MAG002Y]